MISVAGKQIFSNAVFLNEKKVFVSQKKTYNGFFHNDEIYQQGWICK